MKKKIWTWLLLGAAVQLFVGQVGQNELLAIPSATKPRSLLFLENVSVGDLAVKVEGGLFGLCPFDLFRSDRYLAAGPRITRTNDGPARKPLLRGGLRDRWLSENIAVEPSFGNYCGSFAAVLINDSPAISGQHSYSAAEIERPVVSLNIPEENIGAFYIGDGIGTRLGGSSGDYGRLSGASAVANSNDERGESENAKHDLDFVKNHRLFGGFRHAPLLAQVGLIVVAGIGALWIAPIGLCLLFPLDMNGAANRHRKRQFGGLLTLLGLSGFCLLCWVLLSV